MCGFSGIVNISGNKLSQEEFLWHKQITQSLSHRGPDHFGYKKDEWYTISHNRLSIVDLDNKANQPFEVCTSNFILLFNGEIYNYRELRKDLESKYKFITSHSDTEVLYYMWKEHGKRMFNYLNGFFAGAVLDKSTKSIFLFRDRSGKKPLFYSILNDVIVFSSEASAIRFGNYKRNFPISKESISHFLTYLAPPLGKSMFENIQKLRPAEIIEISAKGLNSEIISPLIEDLKFPIFSKPELGFLEKAKKTLIKSLQERLDVDVEVWFALSGGIDSSLNVLYAAKHLKVERINTITISNSNSEYSEHNNAAKLSKIIGCNHKIIDVPESKFANELNEYLSYELDLPAGDMSGVLMYIMSKEVRKQGGKVLIVGEGGDELGGYVSYKKELALSVIKKLNLQQLFKGLKKYKSHEGNVMPLRNQHGFTHKEKSKLLKFNIKDDRDVMYHNIVALTPIKSHMQLLMANEYLYRIPEVIHSRIDLPSMRNGIEVRAPLLDFDLIKLFGNKSWVSKLFPKPKGYLRKLISKFKEADFLVKEKKVGFGMLTDTYIQKISKNEICQWIENDHPILKYLSKEELQYNMSKDMKEISPYKLWILFSLGKWIENVE